MIKTVEFYTVAGTVTIPRTPPRLQPGLAASPSWSNFGRRRRWWSLLSAGYSQDLLPHVCGMWTLKVSLNWNFRTQLNPLSNRVIFPWLHSLAHLKRRGVWRIRDSFSYKPETQLRVCITFKNSPTPKRSRWTRELRYSIAFIKYFSNIRWNLLKRHN